MALTELQKFLIRGLMIFKVEKDAIYGIVETLKTEKQQYAMVEWLTEHEGTSMPEILRKTAELAK